MSVPMATANVICSIREVSKSPRLVEPSRTTMMNMMMKHRLDAEREKKKGLRRTLFLHPDTRKRTCGDRRLVPMGL